MTDTMLQSGQPYTKLDAATTATEFGTVMLSLIVRLETALADVEADKLKLASVIDRVRAQEEATNKLRSNIGHLSGEADMASERWDEFERSMRSMGIAIDDLDGRVPRPRKRPVKK